MDESGRTKLANARADAYAPKPTGGMWMAAFCGAVVALLAQVSLFGFYGWSVSDNIPLTFVVAVTGFVGALLGYLNLGRLSRRARKNERAQIDRDEARPGSVTGGSGGGRRT